MLKKLYFCKNGVAKNTTSKDIARPKVKKKTINFQIWQTTAKDTAFTKHVLALNIF